MPQLVCTIDHLPYGGVVYRNGDRFFASDEDARLLKGFGKARDSSAPAPDSDSSPSADLLGANQPPRRRGRYNRADMRAED